MENNQLSRGTRVRNFRSTLEVLKYSYLALNVPTDALIETNATMILILPDRYDEMKAHRDARDGVNCYHMTVLTPQEFRKVSKEAKTRGESFGFPSEPFSVSIVAIGYGADEKSETWFAICSSPEVNEWRKSLGLEPKDLHITLAFGEAGDVHTISKGLDSMIHMFV